jgi:hypothetical protein
MQVSEGDGGQSCYFFKNFQHRRATSLTSNSIVSQDGWGEENFDFYQHDPEAPMHSMLKKTPSTLKHLSQH